MAEPDYYDDNLLINGDAETGNISPWTGGAVVSGGDGVYCFQINPIATMLQSKAITPVAILENMQISGIYLPEYPIDPGCDRETKLKIQVQINYSDGSHDTVIVPCELGEDA